MRSVQLAFEVLEALAERQPVGVSDLARELDLPKSTVQRSLNALATAGWIRAWPRGEHTKWVLTSKPLTIGGHVLREERLLRAAALPIMQELGAATAETIHLTIRDGPWMVLVDKVDSTQTVRNISWIGGRAPIHAAASGLAILAALDEAQVRSIVDTFERYTESTPTNSEALHQALSETRARGYAINQGMWHADVHAIGAAILDATGAPVAALTISTPAHRLPPDLWPHYGELVRNAATQISREAFGHEATR